MVLYFTVTDKLKTMRKQDNHRSRVDMDRNSIPDEVYLRLEKEKQKLKKGKEKREA